jgi:ABC-type sugar transport system permease subunit
MRLFRGDRFAAIALLGIPLLFEVVWVMWPAIQSIGISTLRWNGTSDATFIGGENFTNLLSDPLFMTAFGNNAKWLLVFGVLSVLGGLALALVLHEQIKGWKIYRSAFFTPIAVSFVVTGFIWKWMFAPSGVVNSGLGAMGLEQFVSNWLGDEDLVLWAVIVAAVWRQVGYIMILFLAGLKSVDVSTIEAATVDGANYWQRLRNVVLPDLAPSVATVVAVTVIDSMRTFDIVWSMTQGGPFNSTQVLSTLMWREAFGNYNLGYASAIAVVILLLTLAFVILYLLRAIPKEIK